MGLIISIGGTPGSGKSTVGRMLAARLGIPFFSVGEVRRRYALAHGMTISEVNERSVTEPELDRSLDEYQAKLPERTTSFVIDSRLGFHFLPQAVKVYIRADTAVAAKRIFAGRRGSERWKTLEEGIASLHAREQSDRQHFIEYCGCDPSDPTQYDLVLDSTHCTLEQLLRDILRFVEKSSRGGP